MVRQDLEKMLETLKVKLERSEDVDDFLFFGKTREENGLGGNGVNLLKEVGCLDLVGEYFWVPYLWVCFC